MKRVNKKFIALMLTIVAIISVMAFPTSAYNNGTVAVNDASGTRLGTGKIYTNNQDTHETDGYILSAQTTAAATSANYVAAQSLVKGMRGWTVYTDESLIMSNNNAKYSPIASLAIPDNVTPLDARGIFGVNTSIAALCKAYNFGNGTGTCSDGASCDFCSDLNNN